MKKLLLIGECNSNPAIYTYATSFEKSFKALGYEVISFNNKKKYLLFAFKYASLINNFVMNFLLQRKLASCKPDVVFILKGENLSVKTIRFAKTCGAKLVNFFPDNPFVVWNGNSSGAVLASLPLYDIFLIWSQQLLPVLETAGAKKVQYFPFGFDVDSFYQLSNLSDTELQNYQSDVCFVGTWEPERERWLTQLLALQPDCNLVIWGNLWLENISQNSLLRRCVRQGAIYGKELLKIFAASKIVLNFIRQQNAGAHNMRTIEVPAAGAFLLTQWSYEQAELLFEENKEVVCFKTAEELVQKVQYYLAHDGTRKQIAIAGQARAREYELKLLLEKLKI